MRGSWLRFSVVLLVLCAGLQSAYAQENPNELEAKFITLYTEDGDFRADVDTIRNMMSTREAFSGDDWKKFRITFNRILLKLYGREMDKKSFEGFKRLVEDEASKVKAYGYYRSKEGESSTAPSTVASSVASAYLPRLYQPTVDIYNLNGLIDTYARVFDQWVYGYYLPGKYIIEVTFVFADEDHPIWDEEYDALRLVNWGRIEDLETFFIVSDKSSGISEKLSFIGLWLNRKDGGSTEYVEIDPCYSGDYSWLTLVGPHLRAKITSFSKYYQHPILYVNVWNHAIGEEDNNDWMSKVRFDTWNSYTNGNRKDAENAYNFRYTYTGEGLNESP
jgi:hypothetical protein